MQILLPYRLDIPENCFYQDFHQGIVDALNELGHEPISFQFAAPDVTLEKDGYALCNLLESCRIDAAIDLACFSYQLTQIDVKQEDEVEGIFDVFGVAYAGMLFDHPSHQAVNGIRARKSYAIYPDLTHPRQTRLAFPNIQLHGEIFAPPAVRLHNDRSVKRWADRDIDVLYVGNLVPQALERFWRVPPPVGHQRPYLPDVCDAIVDAALTNPERSLPSNFDAALAQFDTLPADFNSHLHLQLVELFLRQTFRRAAVVSLARSGVRMRVVGEGWDTVDLPANVEHMAKTNYEEFFCLAGRAKICLDASTYLDGVNDRVFAYGINRAVCFTNAAGYLRPALGEESGTRFYSMSHLSELNEQVIALLASPEVLRDTGERARQTVLAGHTWRHRVEDILAEFR
jgi:hypothetical protein